MAILAKKFNIQKHGGSVEACNVYTTTTEAGGSNVKVIVDGVNGYIPLGLSSHHNATSGRVLSTEYSTGESIPAYTEKSWTSPGTYTFTIPTDINRIRLAVCGGGGGGAFTSEDDNDSHTYYGNDGGISSFGSLISATGGGRGTSIIVDAEYTTGTAGGLGGGPNGRNGSFIGSLGVLAQSTAAGGSGFALGFGNAVGAYGTGGGWSVKATASDLCMAASAGGSGGYDTEYFDVVPGTTYTVTVGAAGANTTGYNEGGVSFSSIPGTSGFVHIAYGRGIQGSVYDTILKSYSIPYSKKTYTTPGTYTFTIPSGVTKVKLTLAGAGGGGGGGVSAGQAGYKSGWIENVATAGGAGGRGGLYTGTITVTPGATYTITVGAGGSAGSSGTFTQSYGEGTAGTNGGTGGSSGFGTYIATGGSGGIAGKGDRVSAGKSGYAYSGTTGAAGTAGTPTGAGGAGGSGGAGTVDGTKGANGWVYIEYGEGIA